MDIYLKFLEGRDVIATLLLIFEFGVLSRKELMEYIGVGNRALSDRTGVLKKQQLITGKTNMTLTPRGKFIATHLHNMNFYLSGGKRTEGGDKE